MAAAPAKENEARPGVMVEKRGLCSVARAWRRLWVVHKGESSCRGGKEAAGDYHGTGVQMGNRGKIAYEKCMF